MVALRLNISFTYSFCYVSNSMLANYTINLYRSGIVFLCPLGGLCLEFSGVSNSNKVLLLFVNPWKSEYISFHRLLGKSSDSSLEQLINPAVCTSEHCLCIQHSGRIRLSKYLFLN